MKDLVLLASNQSHLTQSLLKQSSGFLYDTAFLPVQPAELSEDTEDGQADLEGEAASCDLGAEKFNGPQQYLLGLRPVELQIS